MCLGRFSRCGLPTRLFGARHGQRQGDRSDLRFVGAVGTGFDHKTLDHVQSLLRECARDDPPFAGDLRDLRTGRFGKSLKNPQWVEPVIVARVEFRELTSAGRLRAPSFKGLRGDKKPEECLYSDLVPGAPEG